MFISEYVEPSSGNNKAIEIVNLTGSTINLSEYSIQKQSNGGSWVDDYNLGDVNIIPGEVFVITHIDVSDPTLVAESDLAGPPNVDTSPYGFGSPLNFNGNDPIGFFKNGVLIVIIGEEDNSSDHIKDKTYRRKGSITEPNTRFDTAEWDILGANSFDGIGSHSSALSTKNSAFESFKMFPNPTNGDQVYFRITEATTINIYNILGKLVFTLESTKNKNVINLSKLSKGIYLVKIDSDKKSEIKKLVKN